MAERLHLLSSIVINQHDDPDRERFLLEQRAPFLVRGYRLSDGDIEGEPESFQAIINEHVEDVVETMTELSSLLPPTVDARLSVVGAEEEWLPGRPRECIRGVLARSAPRSRMTPTSSL